jgi:hypothetical protein
MVSLCGLRQDQTEADFSNQGLGAEDAQLIAADIQDNRVALVKLDISDNRLCAEAAIKQICDARSIALQT